MQHVGVTQGFYEQVLGEYIAGRNLALAVPGLSAIEAEHFAVQAVGIALLSSIPIEEIGDPEGDGVRDDLVCLGLVDRLYAAARESKSERKALRDRAERLLERVAESPVATYGVWYADVYSDLAGAASERGDHDRAQDLMRRALAFSIAFDEGRNARSHLRDLARFVLPAAPDEGARLWSRILRHDPTDVWTYVQLDYAAADLGLAEIARLACARGLAVVAGRNEKDGRSSIRKQLTERAREPITARTVDIGATALAELREALERPAPAPEMSDVALVRELVPDLDSVLVKRRPTAGDLPRREEILAALGAAADREAPDDLVMDLRSDRRLPAMPPAVPSRSGPKVGRNDPCTCGSGRKWKRCCGAASGA